MLAYITLLFSQVDGGVQNAFAILYEPGGVPTNHCQPSLVDH